MRQAALQIIDCLRKRSSTVGELSDAIDKSQSWTSEVVSELAEEHLVDRADEIQLASTYEVTLLVELLEQYDLTKILTGTKEDILSSLLSEPQTVSELQQAGFAKSTLYNHLNELHETGVITKSDAGYAITDDTLQSFLEARTKHSPFETTYRADGDRLITTSTDDIDGRQTAFSAFTRYGVEYHSAKTYGYAGDDSLTLEAVLLHAVRVAETKQQMAMAGVFYLTHRDTLDSSDCWRLANKWDCVETWADLLAYIDQRAVQQQRVVSPVG
jgi:Bacterial regulatory protein, arsR family.